MALHGSLVKHRHNAQNPSIRRRKAQRSDIACYQQALLITAAIWKFNFTWREVSLVLTLRATISRDQPTGRVALEAMSQPVPAEPWSQPRLSAPPGHAAWLGKRCKTALGSPSPPELIQPPTRILAA